MAADADWMEAWIGAVDDGRETMSQRSVAAVERNGGIESAVGMARSRGVHLVRLTDDGGKERAQELDRADRAERQSLDGEVEERIHPGQHGTHSVNKLHCRRDWRGRVDRRRLAG